MVMAATYGMAEIGNTNLVLGLVALERFQDCVAVCASACEICDQSASTGTVRRSYCSGNNDRDCNIKNSNSNSATTVTKVPNPQHKLCPVLRCYQHKSQVCGTPPPLFVPLEGQRLITQRPRRFCGCARQAMGFETLVSFCCLCVRHHLRALLISSARVNCARQLYFGCSCCEVA